MRDIKQYGGIYQILNKITGKIYVGSAKYIKKRFGIHKYELRLNIHDNSYLQNAWNKYGEDNFEFEILEIVDDFTHLAVREQIWIDLTQCNNRNKGYNLRVEALNNNGLSYGKGRKLSDEVKDKIRKSNKGKKKSKEACEAQSIRQKGKAPLKATEAARKVHRNIERWPHGYSCLCLECKQRRTERCRYYRALKKESCRGAVAGRI